MTSLKQIEANQRNARASTGPKSSEGKTRSRRNALRHGLTAETVIDVLEDPDDYKAFETSVTADFDAQTAVERELVLRLASLLWRLRRALAIETGLLRVQSETVSGADHAPIAFRRVWDAFGVTTFDKPRQTSGPDPARSSNEQIAVSNPTRDRSKELKYPEPRESKVMLARCFLRLADLDKGVFERLGRYEIALWRQVGQILAVLDRLQSKRLRRSHHLGTISAGKYSRFSFPR